MIAAGRKGRPPPLVVQQRALMQVSGSTSGINKLCYSADGSCILAGGNNDVYICMYHIRKQILMKRVILRLELINKQEITLGMVYLDPWQIVLLTLMLHLRKWMKLLQKTSNGEPCY